MKVYNFSAGPSILPKVVFEQAAQAIVDFKGKGLSILEISHRSEDFEGILQDARKRVKQLMQLGNEYEVLFLQGGATSQFMMAPYNLLPQSGTVGIVDTGTWSTKAIKEAALFGQVQVLASSEEQGYNHIPKKWEALEDLTYLHITSNNTIYGSQYHHIPEVSIPLVADMSSDIFSRPWDYSAYDLIYAGAQKNLGPAGATIVVVKKSLLGKTGRNIPTMLDYQKHIKKQSSLNTPPVFAVYVCWLTLQWIEEQGGLATLGKRNAAKATLLYDEIDRNACFKAHVELEDRSVMNATFTMLNSEKEQAFLELCAQHRINGIKGHRSVGGFRASMYNAMDLEGVEVLVEVMREFERMG